MIQGLKAAAIAVAVGLFVYNLPIVALFVAVIWLILNRK